MGKKSKKWMRPHKNKEGYLQLALRVDGKQKCVKLHRLVAMAYVPPFSGAVVDHINGDPADNRVENLRWGSQVQNMRWARARRAWRTDKLLAPIDQAIACTLLEYYSRESVGRVFGVSEHVIERRIK